MSTAGLLFVVSPVLLLTIALVMGGIPALDCKRNGHRLLVVVVFAFLAVRYYAWRISGGYHVPLLTPASQCFAAFRLVPTMLGSLVKPFGTPFRVTPKGLAIGQTRLDRVTFGMAFVFFMATILGIATHISPNGGASDGFFPVVMFWSTWNLIVLAVVLLMCIEAPRRRSEHRFDADELVGLVGPDFRAVGRAMDLSLSGARVAMPPNIRAQAGQSTLVRVRGVGRIPATAIGRPADVLRVLFDWRDEPMRERMIVKLFAFGAHDVGLRQASLAQILAATWQRAFGITWLDGHNLRLAAAAQNTGAGAADTPGGVAETFARRIGRCAAAGGRGRVIPDPAPRRRAVCADY